MRIFRNIELVPTVKEFNKAITSVCKIPVCFFTSTKLETLLV